MVFPDTNHSFEFLLQHLLSLSSDYIVIAPKLPGYEISSHLGCGQYSVYNLARQVIELLTILLKEYNKKKLHLIGHDWGALIGHTVCQLEPSIIQSFVNISMPAWCLNDPIRIALQVLQFAPRQLLYSWYIFFFQLPLLPQYIIQYQNFALLQKLWNDWSPSPPPIQSPSSQSNTKSSPSLSSSSSSPPSLSYFLDLVKLQFQNNNNNKMSIVLLNALDYYRCNFRNVWIRQLRTTIKLSLCRLISWSVGKQQGHVVQQRSQGASSSSSSFPVVVVPTLAIGGVNDGCIMTQLFQASHTDNINNNNKDFEILIVENAGHFVHLEQPDLVNNRIAAFLEKVSSSAQ